MTTTEPQVVTLKTTYSNWSQTHTVTSTNALDDLVVFNFISFQIFLCFNDFFDFNLCNIVECLLTLNFNCCSVLCLVSTGRWFNGNTRRWKEAWATVHPMNTQHLKDSKTFQCRESQHSHNQLPYERSVEYSGQSNGEGNGRIILKALDEPYKAYFPHTFGLKSADFLFGLM